jgi:DNA-binding CsgD family transcriptional regulator
MSTLATPQTEELTQREFQAGHLVARGCSNREIACALGICEASAKNLVHFVCQKLGARSRVEIAMRFLDETPTVRTSLPSSGLTASDFKVCEGCGAPALIHPRLEIGASNATVGPSRRILCCSCLHAEIEGKVITLSITWGAQMWNCVECWTPRKWGEGRPWDSSVRPALRCAHCQAVTRHTFQRVL